MDGRKQMAELRGHGVSLAWEAEHELARFVEIEREIVASSGLFKVDANGTTIALHPDYPSLHDLAMVQLLSEGHAGPTKMGEGHNLLTTNGAADFFLGLTGGAISGGYYSNANANLGVGDSATAPAVGQTDLQAASNKLRVVMDATYPVLSTNQAQYRMTTGAAQFAWVEWAVFNAAASGRMLNRAVPSGTLGNKTGVTINWQLLVTLSLS